MQFDRFLTRNSSYKRRTSCPLLKFGIASSRLRKSRQRHRQSEGRAVGRAMYRDRLAWFRRRNAPFFRGQSAPIAPGRAEPGSPCQRSRGRSQGLLHSDFSRSVAPSRPTSCTALGLPSLASIPTGLPSNSASPIASLMSSATWKGFTNTGAKIHPGAGVNPRRGRARAGSGDKQRAGFGAMVARHVDAGLRTPRPGRRQCHEARRPRARESRVPVELVLLERYESHGRPMSERRPR